MSCFYRDRASCGRGCSPFLLFAQVRSRWCSHDVLLPSGHDWPRSPRAGALLERAWTSIEHRGPFAITNSSGLRPQCVCEGRESDYHGIAIHPRHLSWYERVVLKRDRYYDPEADKEAKIDELRVLYESHLIAREDPTGDFDDDEHLFISPEVARYFETEGIQGRVEKQTVKERALHAQAPDVRRSFLLCLSSSTC